MSSPAQKARPVPVNTATSSSSESRNSRHASARPVRSSCPSGLLGDLTSMKSSGKLAAAQMTQVDELLPKATSVTTELEKPQVDAARLPQLAGGPRLVMSYEWYVGIDWGTAQHHVTVLDTERRIVSEHAVAHRGEAR